MINVILKVNYTIKDPTPKLILTMKKDLQLNTLITSMYQHYNILVIGRIQIYL